MKSATGESFRASGFNCHAAKMKIATAASVKIHAKPVESAPVASARWAVRGFALSKRTSAMRLTVMAALRAATMATMIQSNCFQVGQPWVLKRAASRAPVRANGKAKTECSNLIISRMVRRRFIGEPKQRILTQRSESSRRRRILFEQTQPINFATGASCFGFFGRGLAGPAEHGVLRQIHLRQHAANVLCDYVVDGFWRVIIRENRGHDYRAGLLSAQHIFQMDAAEWCVAHAENQLAAFLEHDVGGAREEIVASAGSNFCQ